MEVQFLLFEDEESEPSQSLTFNVPSVPQAGDMVTISRPGQEGCTNYAVRRAQWDLDYPSDKVSHRADEIIVGATSAVTVECVFVIGPYASEEHKKTVTRTR